MYGSCARFALGHFVRGCVFRDVDLALVLREVFARCTVFLMVAFRCFVYKENGKSQERKTSAKWKTRGKRKDEQKHQFREQKRKTNKDPVPAPTRSPFVFEFPSFQDMFKNSRSNISAPPLPSSAVITTDKRNGNIFAIFFLLICASCRRKQSIFG